MSALRELPEHGLSPGALGWLDAVHARVDPALRRDAAAFAELTRRHGLSPPDSVLDVQARLAGLTFDEGGGWQMWLSPYRAFEEAGAAACVEHLGERWWPVGGFWVRYLVDARGRVLELDELDAGVVSASSLRGRLEQMALRWGSGRLGDREHLPLGEGRFGDRLAAELGLEPVPEASDDYRRWWRGRLFVEEVLAPVAHGASETRWETSIWGARPRDVARVRALIEAG